MRTDDRRVRLTLAVVASVLGVVALSIGLAPTASVGADVIIDPSLPTDPTTLATVPPTDPPTTVTTAPPTTTTTVAPTTTTTTRPPVITSRPTTTTTRATTTTSRATMRDGTRTTTGTAGTKTGASTPTTRRRVLAATARKRAIRLRDAARLPDLTPSAGGNVPVEVLPRVVNRRSSRGQVPLDAPGLDARSARSSGDSNSMTIMAVVVGVAGLALIGFGARAVARSRRDRGGVPLFVERDAGEIELRVALVGMVANGAIDVSGSDCRALQLLVKVAALEGFEIRDPEGFVPRASERLVQAFGFEPDRKRLPLHWKVTVGPRSVAIPEGAQFLVQETGSDGTGRRLAFAPGTPLDLWDGDCL